MEEAPQIEVKSSDEFLFLHGSSEREVPFSRSLSDDGYNSDQSEDSVRSRSSTVNQDQMNFSVSSSFFLLSPFVHFLCYGYSLHG